MLEIFNYTAGAGDCIRLHFTGGSGQNRNVLIDSGVTSFGLRFREICVQIQNQNEGIDALVITHVDADHLGGLLWNLRNKANIPITEVWMNHGELQLGAVDLSVRQSDEVYTRLIQCGTKVRSAIKGTVYEIDGVKFNILWPTESVLEKLKYNKCTSDIKLGRHSDYGYSLDELMNAPICDTDNSDSNRASIILETKIDGMQLLLPGDAWSTDILSCCKGKHYDLIKLPHHGSVRNVSEEWKGELPCNNYIICTDGLKHPDKQTIAKLLKWNGSANFYVSADWWRKLILAEDEKYRDKLCFIVGEKNSWKDKRTQ